MRFFAIQLSILGLLGAPAAAQVCVPLPATGQPGFPVSPPCAGLVPPAVLYAVGNPGFTVMAAAPLPPLIGMPMLLAIGFTGPPIPFPAPPLFPPFGPGIVAVVFPVPFVSPLFIAPGPVPIAVPLPPMGGPLGLILTAHTVVLVGGTLAVSAGTGIVI